jgi:flagellar biosynthesis/type III secretory pathway protein FliH
MKPVSIADYLDHIGRPAAEKVSARRETSPFRPRSLHSLQSLEPRSPPVFDHAAKALQAVRPETQEKALRPLWERRSASVEVERESLAAHEAARAEETALKLEEARALGREEGVALGRAQAEERFAADRAALQEQAVMERLEFQLNEYAQLEATVRAGFAEVEARVGAAVARILAPFLVKEVVKYAANELTKSIARLTEGGAPGLISIRGPERVLSLLRDRVADLPAEIVFVEDGGVEATVECNATRIVTELKPWADLLASLDA